MEYRFWSKFRLNAQAVDIVEKSNPDIIDINFGCPVKKVVSKGAGAGILKDIDKMERLTKEIVKRTKLPVYCPKQGLAGITTLLKLLKLRKDFRMWVTRQ